MTRLTLLAFFIHLTGSAMAQTNPAILHWLINTTNLKGRHYVQGNGTPVQDNVLANVQSVQYSDNWVYVKATGIPAYITGPFLDGNPSLATAQTGFFKLPLQPVKQTGTPSPTTPGNIGIFINGVALFDYRDGVAWNPNTNALCGGPGNPPCPGGPNATNAWNRDAIRAERAGFDCAKGHPAMGNYHHHQNPSAFNLDLTVISNICDLYLADGLYKIDSTTHSPLLGFAYDGFPIYGGYGYKNADGTGGISRIKSGYRLRDITLRTTHADGTDVSDGPPISATYPLGYFREDYGYVADSSSDVLDIHNGRICVTPEYPNGTYAYFCTINADWNSAYPYAVGPSFYGQKTASKVNSINEPVQTYNPSVGSPAMGGTDPRLGIFPNPTGSFLAIQVEGLLREEAEVELLDLSGKRLQTTRVVPGSTIAYLDVQTCYPGTYVVVVRLPGRLPYSRQVVVE
jgi:hypothetical protein